MDLKALNKEIAAIVNKQNNTGLDQFDGYTPSQVHVMIHQRFQPQAPVRLKNLNELKQTEFRRVPLFNGVRFLLTLIEEADGIKLTATGSLPTKFVELLYDQSFYTEYHVDFRRKKILKETDSHFVLLCRVFLLMGKAVRTVKGKLVLTKTGKTWLTNDVILLEKLLSIYCQEFNFAFFDAYEDQNIANIGASFSIYLLHRYGAQARPLSFYADKYFKAFPQDKNFEHPYYRNVKDFNDSFYGSRTMSHFGLFTGIIELDPKDLKKDCETIKKSDLLDQFFEVELPG